MKATITKKTQVEAVVCDRCGRAPALKVEIFVDRREPPTKAIHSSDLCNDCTDFVVRTARERRKRKPKAASDVMQVNNSMGEGKDNGALAP